MTKHPPSLLIYCADPGFADRLRAWFGAPRYHVALAQHPGEALSLLKGVRFDAAVLVWHPADPECLPLLGHLKASAPLPTCMVVRSDDVALRDEFLARGADECFANATPGEPLAYRLQGFLRRHSETAPTLLQFGHLTLNPTTFAVRWRDREIRLGLIEFRLLDLFLHHHGETLSRTRIFEETWPGSDYAMGRLVDVHVSNLRKAFLRDAQIRPIQTVRGAGYRLRLKAVG